MEYLDKLNPDNEPAVSIQKVPLMINRPSWDLAKPSAHLIRIAHLDSLPKGRSSIFFLWTFTNKQLQKCAPESNRCSGLEARKYVGWVTFHSVSLQRSYEWNPARLVTASNFTIFTNADDSKSLIS